ncbi:acyltransferase [Porticoccus litoralis]|uniref:Acyltransferase n=1 Tax=Porticoccus litoralis TaxID=434086 RepID=A0AAW8B553_9GAMM|nr:acyltransferase [Porticoccus litoralis]MDP1521033.1 acyltransferase [Porticoccus litoralis]
MLKVFFERIIRSYKNPGFRFDPDISSVMLCSFVCKMLIEWLRGLRLVLFLKLPRFLFLGRGVSFSHLSRIELGKWVVLGDFVTLSGLGRGKLTLGDGCRIGSFSRVVVSTTLNNLGEHIHLGHHVAIGDYSSLGGSGGLDIGANTITGQYFSVHPENHRFDDPERPIRQQGTQRKPVRIGENCWLGAKVTVLAGVTIGNNCVIGAGSLVTKDIPNNSIAVGNPARVIRSL